MRPKRPNSSSCTLRRALRMVKARAQAVEDFKKSKEFGRLLGQYRSGSYHYGLRLAPRFYRPSSLKTWSPSLRSLSRSTSSRMSSSFLCQSSRMKTMRMLGLLIRAILRMPPTLIRPLFRMFFYFDENVTSTLPNLDLFFWEMLVYSLMFSPWVYYLLGLCFFCTDTLSLSVGAYDENE